MLINPDSIDDLINVRIMSLYNLTKISNKFGLIHRKVTEINDTQMKEMWSSNSSLHDINRILPNSSYKILVVFGMYNWLKDANVVREAWKFHWRSCNFNSIRIWFEWVAHRTSCSIKLLYKNSEILISKLDSIENYVEETLIMKMYPQSMVFIVCK